MARNKSGSKQKSPLDSFNKMRKDSEEKLS